MSGTSDRDLRTIVVRRLPGTVTGSEIELYFQSNRSGGGDVEDVVFMERGSGCAHVIFEDEDDAVSVAARRHSVRNSPVEVELLRPRAAIQQPKRPTVNRPRAPLASSSQFASAPFAKSSSPAVKPTVIEIDSDDDDPAPLPVAETKSSPRPVVKAEPVDGKENTRHGEHLPGVDGGVLVGGAGGGRPPVRDNNAAAECTGPPPGTRCASPRNDLAVVESASDELDDELDDELPAVLSTARTHAYPAAPSPAPPKAQAPSQRDSTPDSSARKKQADVPPSEPAKPPSARPQTMLEYAMRMECEYLDDGLLDGEPGAADDDRPAGWTQQDSEAPGAVWAKQRESCKRTQHSPRDGRLSPESSVAGSPKRMFTGVMSAPLEEMPTDAANSAMRLTPSPLCDTPVAELIHQASGLAMAAGDGEPKLSVASASTNKPASAGAVSSAARMSNCSTSQPTPPETPKSAWPPSSRLPASSTCHSPRSPAVRRVVTSPPGRTPTNSGAASAEPRPLAALAHAPVAHDPLTTGRKVAVLGDLSRIPSGYLLMYFDSRTSSGGGGVETVEAMSDESCFILFEDCEDAERVCTRDHTVLDMPLKVELVLPQREASAKILVSRLPSGCDEEGVELYFDSKKRSGGGGVVNVEMSEDCQQAIVTFGCPEIAAAVSCRSHSVSKQPVVVQLVTASRPHSSRLTVCGIPSAVGEEELEMYFESKRRSAGGDIAELQYCTKTGSACVTYSSPYRAMRVADRSHCLRGSPLTVSISSPSAAAGPSPGLSTGDGGAWQAPSEYESDKFILLDIPPSISDELVRLYIKAATPTVSGIVVQPYPENCRALVTFPCAVDFSKLLRYVTEEPLKKKRVGVRRVRKSSVIRIRGGLQAGVNEELLKYYFRAEMSVTVNVHIRQGIVDVEFPSPQGAGKALSREHSVHGQALQLFSVMAGLDYPGDEDSAASFALDATSSMRIELRVGKPYLLLIQQCAVVREQLVAALADACAEITAVDMTSLVMTITPIAGSEAVFGWRAHAETCTRDLLGTLAVKSLKLSPEVYQEAVGTNRLRNDLWRFTSDLALIPSLEDWSVTFVGVSASVEAAHRAASEIVAQFEVTLREHVQEVVKLRPHVHAFFRRVRFDARLTEKFPRVTVTLGDGSGRQKGAVVLAGARSEVAPAAREVLNSLPQVLDVRLGFEHAGLVDVLARDAGQHFMEQALRRDNAHLEAAIFIGRPATTTATATASAAAAQISLVGWSNDEEELLGLKSALEEQCGASVTVALEEHEAEATGRGEWQQFVAEVEAGGHPVHVEAGSVRERLVRLSGVAQSFGAVRRLLARHMLCHAQLSSSLPITLGQERFVAAHLRARVGTVKQQCGLSHVDVAHRCITLRGNAGSIESGRDAFRRLLATVHSALLPMVAPGMRHFFGAAVTKKAVGEIERLRHVMIECVQAGESATLPPMPGADAVARSDTRAAGGAPSASAGCVTFAGDRSVSVVQGDLSKAKADVIVCTSSQGLDLSESMVAKALSKAAGPALQEECKAFVQAHGKVAGGTFAVTAGHSLQCQLIFHCSCSLYSGQASCQEMEGIVMRCLLEADRRQMHSVALSSMGTGKLSFPAKESARLMFQAAVDFFRGNPASSVAKIVFVVFDDPVMAAFSAAAADHNGAAAAAGGDMFTPSTTTATTATSVTIASAAAATGPTPAVTPAAIAGGGGLPSGIIPGSTLCVQLHEGDITAESVDAVVVTVNSALDMSAGAVAPAVLARAGAAGHQDWLQLLQMGTMDAGSALRITGGDFAPHLLLAVCPKASQGAELLQATISNALAEAEHCAATSVALPALGSGRNGFSAEEGARAMTRALLAFAPHAVHVRLVRVVLFDKHCVAAFPPAFADILAGGSGSDSGGSAAETARTAVAQDVVLGVYGQSLSSLEAAKEDIASLCRERYVSKALDKLAGSALDDVERRRVVRGAEASFGVHVAILPDRVVFSGEGFNVLHAHSEVLKVFSDHAERSRAQKHAASVAQIVQWSCANRGTADFGAAANMRAEEAYQAFRKKTGPSMVVLDDGSAGQPLGTLDFVAMTIVPPPSAGSVTVAFPVKRKDFTRKDVIPAHWDPALTLKVALLATSAEYQAVATAFQRTCPSQILFIERIQNQALYVLYQAKKEAMDNNQASGYKSNERRLFHGTDAGTADKICSQGFNRSFAGRNATMYGRGAYFARDSSYSARYSPTSPRQMFQALVLVGEYAVGAANILAPPSRRTNSLELKDSTVDRKGDPTIFVTYHDSQTYPEYLITFQ